MCHNTTGRYPLAPMKSCMQSIFIKSKGREVWGGIYRIKPSKEKNLIPKAWGFLAYFLRLQSWEKYKKTFHSTEVITNRQVETAHTQGYFWAGFDFLISKAVNNNKTDLAVWVQEMVPTLSQAQIKQQEEPRHTQLNQQPQFALQQASPHLQDKATTHWSVRQEHQLHIACLHRTATLHFPQGCVQAGTQGLSRREPHHVTALLASSFHHSSPAGILNNDTAIIALSQWAMGLLGFYSLWYLVKLHCTQYCCNSHGPSNFVVSKLIDKNGHR